MRYFNTALIITVVALLMLWATSPIDRQPEWTKLPLCEQEDSPGPCTWLADHQGNGEGRSFWVDREGELHYLED